MSVLGTAERPLRVAIVGSGPSGFYTADALLRQNIKVKVDLFDKLPVPFGLVRHGVAPDHQKIKNVIKIFEKIAVNPQFSYFGHVTIGKDISVFELNKYYDAVVFAYGAESDRHLGIHGEDLAGSYTATEFVGWYNGHPDFQDRHFDLSHEVAVIVGNGNVAMDVARILCKTPEELKGTDITQNALDLLAESKIKEVHLYGRRGPVQASFTAPELREMGELSTCCPVVNPQDLELNESSLKELEDPNNAWHKKNLEILQHFLSISPEGRKRKFVMHFLRSPVEMMGKERVQKVRFEINSLTGDPNKQKVRGTGKFEEIDCGIFFRSVGYAGTRIQGLPFSNEAGIVPNQSGRVIDPEQIFTGWYVAGWIKRGAVGIIGSNKPDAEETVRSLTEDISRLNACEIPSSEALLKLLRERNVQVVTFDDWKKIDAEEILRGSALGKPREKFSRITGMLSAIFNKKHAEKK
ncbi:MAG: FAD-dependent oxidoreductase [Candidatus Omnitrophica bacterium]|nr:FAD-dependent oxidoreductase [Candidatus Omnitrophota bacterium]